jgi:serine/threonine-protein kinase RsbW
VVSKKKIIERTFPARFSSLEKIRDFVLQAAKEINLDEKATYAVELAVDEACTNIIEHAYDSKDNGLIECCTSTGSNNLKIVLRDFGKEFDPTKIPQPQIDVPLDQIKPRGVGYFLMNKMMDEVIYKRYKTRGNTMTLIKKKVNHSV